MKLSIRWALIAGFLCLIWGTYAVTTTSTFVSSQKVLNRHARDIMENIADLAMEQSQNHLAHAHGAAALTRRLLNANVVSDNENSFDSLERYFLDQLAIYPHFAGIYLGKPNGDFYYVSRNEQRSAGGFRTKIISHREGIRQARLLWRNKNLEIIADEIDPDDSYDPRVRPWYKSAIEKKNIVWTDPYVFFTSQKPGITIAGPTYDESGRLEGIVGVDIEIDQLSTFIANLNIGKNGRAFMINNNGDVVAFPDLEKIKTKAPSASRSYRLVKIHELDDIMSRKAFVAVGLTLGEDGRFDLNESRFARFEHNGRYYHAMLTPFSITQWPWIVGVHLPEDDYLGALKKNRLFNILLTLAISIAATLVALLLARSIIRPITNLEKEALAVKNDDMQSRFDIHSRYKEIEETASSFILMKETIRESQEKYRGIFENIQDVYYETSLDGVILEISPSIEKVTPYKRTDLVGSNVNQVYLAPGTRKQLIQTILENKRISNYEIVLKAADGTPLYYSLNSVLISDEQGKPQKIIGSMRNITSRKKIEAELDNYREHLEELVKERTADLEKANEKLHEEMEQRLQTENERKRLEDQLQQAHRLEAIGRLAGGIAHDFNNLLMGIQGNVTLLLMALDVTDPRYENVRSIERCVQSGADLTRQLLGYARGGKYAVKPTDLNDVVQRSSTLFGRTRKEIKVVGEYQKGVWSVEVDRNQIEQVLVNLYLNAGQAMEHGGTIFLTIENIILGKDFVKPYGTIPGKYVKVSVGDTGTGMDEETQKRVFEPFFTTKSMGRGTGLGLASAFGIIKNHNGIIHFTSKAGKGTTFYIYLPASDRPVETEHAVVKDVQPGEETILIVDDEQFILEACKDMLTKIGYNIILAGSGEEAVETFRSNGDIDLIILDMVMPGMDGLEAYEHFKGIDPEVKVIISSGYSITDITEKIQGLGCDEYIQKPFTLNQISRIIRELLDGRSDLR